MFGLFGEDYRAAFGELLRAHLDAAQKRKSGCAKWCAFWPMVGRKFRPGGVMVVGRALNGWGDSAFTCESLSAPGGTEALIARCRDTFAPADSCPMVWVQQRWHSGATCRTSRSQFWQTACRLATHHGYREQDWPSSIVWTNLMRVSPARGGNPPDWSYSAQLGPAAKLLDYELRDLRPGVAVLLTGPEWYRPFRERTGLFRLREVHLEHVHYVGQHGPTRMIVCDHPQRRSPDRIMREIVQHWPQA